MTKRERLIDRFKSCTGTFLYRDFVSMMGGLGYELHMENGSRRRFVHRDTKHIVRLHEPHPQKEMKAYMVKLVREQLIDKGVI
ncbi:type II toxin-antitoxin system HicA family toxin [Stappia sp. ES.058]|uniref:type II toxin-antitoxin system HicA family toxin n=1 Tax=Stappia sp. ES.058 TaxID=1881061 RepID=UPI00087C1441|nr:type II toxin-antitoxin system HicA family toxin [Stappia sp. ES.058]SDU26357.1 HicA toxin of toxin-antitoxin [Stappia sp. ES.058]